MIDAAKDSVFNEERIKQVQKKNIAFYGANDRAGKIMAQLHIPQPSKIEVDFKLPR